MKKLTGSFFATPVVRTATIEEFFSAIAQSSGKNLDQFISTWLSQAGVPELEISTEYHETQQEFILKIKQILPVSQDDPEAKKSPLPHPLDHRSGGSPGQRLPLGQPGPPGNHRP
jgi:aminopeptidase N